MTWRRTAARVHQIRYFQECALTALPGDARTAPPSYRYFIDMVERLRRLQPQDLTENSVLFGVPAQIAEVLKKTRGCRVRRGHPLFQRWAEAAFSDKGRNGAVHGRDGARFHLIGWNGFQTAPRQSKAAALGIGLESRSLTRRSDLVVGLGHWMPARLLTPYGLKILASRTANAPVRKIPSKVPAPPIEATGAPSPSILPRLRRSAPIRQPSEPLI